MRIVLGNYPNPKQYRFFTSQARHVCYGGAKAGGKSWAVRAQAVRLACMYKDVNILLLRRTFPELRDNHIVPLQSPVRVCKYNVNDKVFTFPNGSRIVMGYCDKEGDAGAYQGHEYEYVFSRRQPFTERMYTELILCNRTSRGDLKPQAYYTCNPGESVTSGSSACLLTTIPRQ